MSEWRVDTSDPGKAAQAIFAAACLNARVAGMIATNTERERHGYALAYSEADFESAILRAKEACEREATK